MTESLPGDVADVLDFVLGKDEPVHVALRKQVPHLSVRSRCACGCGTAHFALDTSEAEPAPTSPGTAVAADVQLLTETGECPGEVLVFVQSGYLSSLEVCSWSDEVEVNLTASPPLAATTGMTSPPAPGAPRAKGAGEANRSSGGSASPELFGVPAEPVVHSACCLSA